MTRKLFLSGCFASALLFGTVAATSLPAWKDATISSTQEALLRERVTLEHERVCHLTLRVDARITTIARYRAMDMGLNGYFDHENPWSKRKVWTLLDRSGIKWLAGGEDLAWNNFPDGTTAAEAYRGLMASTSHRTIIRDCSYNTVGVGAYRMGSKRIFALLFVRL